MATIWKIIYHSQYSVGRERLFVNSENENMAKRLAELHLEAVCEGWSKIDSIELTSIAEVLRCNVLNYNG